MDPAGRACWIAAIWVLRPGAGTSTEGVRESVRRSSRLVEAGVDGFLHSVRDAEMDDALVARMKQRNVYITPNLSIGGRGVTADQPPWFDDPLLAEAFSPAAIARVRPGQNQGAGAGRGRGAASTPGQPSSYEMQIRSLAKLSSYAVTQLQRLPRCTVSRPRSPGCTEY